MKVLQTQGMLQKTWTGKKVLKKQKQTNLKQARKRPQTGDDRTKTYASGTPSPAAKKILDEKGVSPARCKRIGS
jgi:2-oxoglutarate dehydrogenase E2 component (dihydrolipoamide succinyltransferase)